MNRIEIKKWLLDAGLTQAELAREIGISKYHFSKVIKGIRRSDTVVAVLRQHGCPEKYLRERRPE